MRSAITALRRTSLAVAALLAVAVTLRLAGAGSAPPSPTYKDLQEGSCDMT